MTLPAGGAPGYLVHCPGSSQAWRVIIVTWEHWTPGPPAGEEPWGLVCICRPVGRLRRLLDRRAELSSVSGNPVLSTFSRERSCPPCTLWSPLPLRCTLGLQDLSTLGLQDLSEYGKFGGGSRMVSALVSGLANRLITRNRKRGGGFSGHLGRLPGDALEGGE